MWTNTASHLRKAQRFGLPSNQRRAGADVIASCLSSLSNGSRVRRPTMPTRLWSATGHTSLLNHPVGCYCCRETGGEITEKLTWTSSNDRSYQSRFFSSSTNNGPRSNNKENETTEADHQDVVVSGEPSGDLRIPGAQKGGKKLAIVFTCTVCGTRSAKQFTEQAYNHGVVIVQCPGCNNRHLIADNLGFFSDEDEGWNIEKAMAKLGENVQVANNDNVLELSLEDIYGEEAIEAAFKGDRETNLPSASQDIRDDDSKI